MRRSDRNFKTLPDGNLGIIAMESCKSLGNLIDKYITGWRGDEAPRYQNCPDMMSITRKAICWMPAVPASAPEKQKESSVSLSAEPICTFSLMC